MTTRQHDPAIAVAGNTFETALKQARIPLPLHDGMWDIWAGSPARAYALIARFKDNGQTLAVTYKASGDSIDQLGAQFLALLREVGDDEAKAWLTDAIAEMEADDDEEATPAPITAKVTSSGPMSKTKTAPADPWQNPDFSDMRPR